ncbi:MAG: caspase family protein, partial [Roseiarcus sp.]
VTFGDGAEIKGVKDMRVPMMRRDDPPAQDSLAGVRVKISDNYFLVGLNRADADAARNVDLIASRGWFDFPMLLNDDRIAKLTFEKGADGDRILAEALAAWKAP